jgi:hypothetical protein
MGVHAEVGDVESARPRWPSLTRPVCSREQRDRSQARGLAASLANVAVQRLMVWRTVAVVICSSGQSPGALLEGCRSPEG